MAEFEKLKKTAFWTPILYAEMQLNNFTYIHFLIKVRITFTSHPRYRIRLQTILNKKQ